MTTDVMNDIRGILKYKRCLHRFGPSDEIARLIVFLLSDEADSIAAATYMIDDGGQMA